MSDSTYHQVQYRANELHHRYGDTVHIVSDPFALTRLARLCSPGVYVPEVSRLVQALYRDLIKTVVNSEFPRVTRRIDSRMIAYTEHGYYDGIIIDPDTEVTTVNIARAGTLPSQICFETLSELLSPAKVRQDHLLMSRILDTDAHVTGAGIGGIKLAGPIDGRFLLFPDPMGATGSSLSTAMRYYKEHLPGTPKKIIAVNLIVTPEYLKRITTDHPDVLVYAYRVDRGLSSPDILQSIPGTCWNQERGLTDNHYIVPGGGGFGEILNNALE